MVVLALHKGEFSSMREEIDAINLPHGTKIYIPEKYWKKIIMYRCAAHKNLYTSRLRLEQTICTIAAFRSAAYQEIRSSIVWYWGLSAQKRAELEARYRNFA